jgi:multimeric flavodoxin WrbA
VVSFGLVGGGRLDGNTATAVSDVLAGAGENGATTMMEQLAPGGVLPIGDCAACVARGDCSLDDQFSALMQAVYDCDLLVLGTPLYWYGPSAQLKAFLDRWSCLLDLDEAAFRDRMRGKRTVLVVAQGERGFYESAPCLQMLEWSLRYLDMPLVARVVVVGHARTDYRADAGQRERVRRAGGDAVRSAPPDAVPPWFHLRHAPGGTLGGIYSP